MGSPKKIKRLGLDDDVLNFSLSSSSKLDMDASCRVLRRYFRVVKSCGATL